MATKTSTKKKADEVTVREIDQSKVKDKPQMIAAKSVLTAARSLGSAMSKEDKSREQVSAALVDLVETCVADVEGLADSTKKGRKALRAVLTEHISRRYDNATSVRATVSKVGNLAYYMASNGFKTVRDVHASLKGENAPTVDNTMKLIREANRGEPSKPSKPAGGLSGAFSAFTQDEMDAATSEDVKIARNAMSAKADRKIAAIVSIFSGLAPEDRERCVQKLAKVQGA